MRVLDWRKGRWHWEQHSLENPEMDQELDDGLMQQLQRTSELWGFQMTAAYSSAGQMIALYAAHLAAHLAAQLQPNIDLCK